MLRDVQGNDTGRDIHIRHTQHTEPTLATKKKSVGRYVKSMVTTYFVLYLHLYFREANFDYKGTGEETL